MGKPPRATGFDGLRRAEQDTLRRIFAHPTNTFSDLVNIAGLDPSRDLKHLNLSEVNFAGSDLRFYDFTGANLRNTRWKGAIYDSTTIIAEADFSEADIDRSKVEPRRASRPAVHKLREPSMQATLRAPVTISGVGLHSGDEASLILHPAETNHG